MSRENNTKKIVICALLVSVSFVLNELVPHIHLPGMGGSVTAFSMLPAALTGYFCGPFWGFFACISRGLLDMLLDGHFLHPAQILLDYILGFGVLGLSGLFWKKKNGLYTGYIFGCMMRFICSFLSGFIFFSEYAPETMNPIWYSFVYNLSYIGTEMVITVVLLLIPVVHNTIYKLKEKF